MEKLEEFKVGDRVKIKPGSDYDHQNKLPGIIKYKNDSGWWKVEFQDGYENAYRNEDLIKLPPEKTKEFNSKETTIKKKSFMSNIMQKLKDLTLSETDRLLREEGFEDENGKMTPQAEDLMDEELLNERWQKRREEVAANIKKIKEQEKK